MVADKHSSHASHRHQPIQEKTCWQKFKELTRLEKILIVLVCILVIGNLIVMYILFQKLACKIEKQMTSTCTTPCPTNPQPLPQRVEQPVNGINTQNQPQVQSYIVPTLPPPGQSGTNTSNKTGNIRVSIELTMPTTTEAPGYANRIENTNRFLSRLDSNNFQSYEEDLNKFGYRQESLKDDLYSIINRKDLNFGSLKKDRNKVLKPKEVNVTPRMTKEKDRGFMQNYTLLQGFPFVWSWANL